MYKQPRTRLPLRILSLVLVFFAFSFGKTSAQNVSGTVTDDQGKPLPNVSVLVKGSQVGTTSDNAGKFTVNDGANKTLVFSHIGFQDQEIATGTRSTINVSMALSLNSDETVVVTALGIRRQSKKLGYSATSVNTEDLVVNRTNNVMESLVGKVSGLNITPPAAGAGASTQIRLRGQVGFTGSNNAPLLVINGLPLDQGARGADGAGQQRDRGDNLLNLNPDDIESMTVLKGSTASALYGSRAAAGAIIITTKTGNKNSGIGVEFTTSNTWQQALNFMDQFQTEYGQGTGGNKPTTQGQAQSTGQFGWGARLDGSLVPIFDGTLQPYVAYEDRLFDYYRTGTNFTNSIAFSGGGANGSFRVSVSNTNADGIDPYNEYNRKTVNIGLNQNITQRLKLNVNVNWANEEQVNPPQIGTQGAGAVNFFTRLAISIPGSALKNSATNPANGTEAVTSGFQTTLLNPYYAYNAGQKWINKRDRILSTATLRWDITDWLYAQGRFNYDYSSDFTESVTPGGIGTSNPLNADGTYKGSFNVSQGKGTDINADFLVGVNKEFGKFSVDASFGGNTWTAEDRNTNVGATNFIAPDQYNLTLGNVKSQGFGYGKDRTNSLYGLVELGFNDLLYLSVTGREDWFSVYNIDNNHVFYPGASGSFIFSELLPNAKSWLNYGKLRASWAQTGSRQGVGRYEAGVLYYNVPTNNFNGVVTGSVAGNTVPNPNLLPFKVEETEIGLELRLFNRLRIDVAAFNKITSEQVLDVTLSNASGFTGTKDNLASLRNRGLETNVEYQLLKTRNFTWNTSWNNTFLATKVLSISPGVDELLVINFNATGNEFLGQLRYTVGLPMNQLYTRTYLRDDKGDIIVGGNGRLKATPNYVPVGSSIPKYTGGWTNEFRYKDLSVGVFIDYKFGGTVLSSTALNNLRQGHSKASLVGRREGENGVVFPGINESTGQLNTVAVNPQDFYADYRNLQIGDPFTFKSDFIKLRSVSLSYNFTSLMRKTTSLNFVKGLSLTASVRNVAIIYKDLEGLDPEAVQSSGDTRAGYENAAMPTTRNYNVSLNVKF